MVILLSICPHGALHIFRRQSSSASQQRLRKPGLAAAPTAAGSTAAGPGAAGAAICASAGPAPNMPIASPIPIHHFFFMGRFPFHVSDFCLASRGSAGGQHLVRRSSPTFLVGERAAILSHRCCSFRLPGRPVLSEVAILSGRTIPPIPPLSTARSSFPTTGTLSFLRRIGELPTIRTIAEVGTTARTIEGP